MKYIKIVKRGNSRVVMVSEDGDKWMGLEQAYGLEGDFDVRFGLKNLTSTPFNFLEKD